MAPRPNLLTLLIPRVAGTGGRRPVGWFRHIPPNLSFSDLQALCGDFCCRGVNGLHREICQSSMEDFLEVIATRIGEKSAKRGKEFLIQPLSSFPALLVTKRWWGDTLFCHNLSMAT
jgi:hypothetical protein